MPDLPRELARCTWPEAEEALGPRTIALLPIGCTEPHGPHLPLDTDVTIARAQALRAAERLREEGVSAIVLPAIGYGITNFTDGFAGRITLRPGTLWALVEDVVTALEQQDVRQVVLSNGHLEPEHVALLRGVAADHPERGRQRAQVLFPDNTRRRWAETLGEEFASGDCHAGRYETSLVLAADPTGVSPAAMRGLPAVRIDLLERIRAGARTFREAGAERAYCGNPGAASAAEGRELVERLAAMIVESAREAWPDLFR
jgi:creatinine amidohydrolase